MARAGHVAMAEAAWELAGAAATVGTQGTVRKALMGVKAWLQGVRYGARQVPLSASAAMASPATSRAAGGDAIWAPRLASGGPTGIGTVESLDGHHPHLPRRIRPLQGLLRASSPLGSSPAADVARAPHGAPRRAGRQPQLLSLPLRNAQGQVWVGYMRATVPRNSSQRALGNSSSDPNPQ